MSSTSLFGKAIEYEPGEHAANEAVDTLQARVIANNVAHLADASSQVFVAAPPDASGNGISRTYSASGSLFMLHATYGPFFPRIRSTGRPNAVRYRIHCRTETASNNVEFAVWLHSFFEAPGGIGSAVTAFEAGDNAAVQIHTATSTTPGWVAPDAGNPLLRMTPSEASASTAPIGAVDSGFRTEIGGDRIANVVPWTAISIFSRRASGSSATAAELTGFYAAEFFA